MMMLLRALTVAMGKRLARVAVDVEPAVAVEVVVAVVAVVAEVLMIPRFASSSSPMMRMQLRRRGAKPARSSRRPRQAASEPGLMRRKRSHAWIAIWAGMVMKMLRWLGL